MSNLKLKKAMIDLKKLVYKMLTEGTGKHILDSGDAYGRNWERNQKRTLEDFEADEPVSEICSRIEHKGKVWWDIERTVSVFQFLAGSSSNLFLDERCDEWNALVDMDQEKHGNSRWSERVELHGVTESAAKLWEDWEQTLGVEIIRTFNTYNGESDLSQILQGSFVRIDGDPYLVLQIHNGCDARGGYTSARLFYMTEEYLINECIWEFEYRDELWEMHRAHDWKNLLFEHNGKSDVTFSELPEDYQNELNNGIECV